MRNDGAQSASSLRCHFVSCEMRSGPNYYQKKIITVSLMPLSAVVIHVLVIERPSGVFVILSPAITPREPMGRTRVRHFDRVCATERPRERVRRCVCVCVCVRMSVSVCERVYYTRSVSCEAVRAYLVKGCCSVRFVRQREPRTT